jgi:hypothetical protein
MSPLEKGMLCGKARNVGEDGASWNRPSLSRTAAQPGRRDRRYGVAGAHQAASVRRTTHLVAELSKSLVYLRVPRSRATRFAETSI